MVNIQLKHDIVQSLAQDSSVIAAYVLGSFARGEVGPESDFDLAVAVDKVHPASSDTIYELLKNIQFPKNLDLSVIDSTSSPLFLFQVISKGERIFERNTNDIVQFEAFTLHNYYDTAHLRAMFAEKLNEKFIQTTYAN